MPGCAPAELGAHAANGFGWGGLSAASAVVRVEIGAVDVAGVAGEAFGALGAIVVPPAGDGVVEAARAEHVIHFVAVAIWAAQAAALENAPRCRCREVWKCVQRDGNRHVAALSLRLPTLPKWYLAKGLALCARIGASARCRDDAARSHFKLNPEMSRRYG